MQWYGCLNCISSQSFPANDPARSRNCWLIMCTFGDCIFVSKHLIIFKKACLESNIWMASQRLEFHWTQTKISSEFWGLFFFMKTCKLSHVIEYVLGGLCLYLFASFCNVCVSWQKYALWPLFRLLQMCVCVWDAQILYTDHVKAS